jgi:hypothetical protein
MVTGRVGQFCAVAPSIIAKAAARATMVGNFFIVRSKNHPDARGTQVMDG